MAHKKAVVTVTMPLLALGVAIVLAFQNGVFGGLGEQIQELAVSGAMGGKGKPVAVETLDRGMMGPWQAETEVMVQSPEEWSGTMEEYAAQGMVTVAPTAPQVDWKTQTVVLVALGVQNTAGWSVEVAGATRKGNKLVLDVIKTRPAGGTRIPSMCAPYHLVRLESPGVKELVIEERWEVEGAGTTAMSGGAAIGGDSTRSTSWGDIKQKYTNP